MENNNPLKRIHPLVAGAAVSVMLVSLTGVAAITGLIPSSYSNAAPNGAATAATPTTASAATPAALVESRPEAESPAQTPAPEKHAAASQPAHTGHSHRASSGTAYAVAQAPAICSSCGSVESVHAVQQQAKASGVGMVAGALLGGVLGNQVGGGNGRKVATVAGAVGGGYAGNEIEKRTRGTTTYQVRVRMENGQVRTFPYSQQPGWNVGDRVRVVNGHLTSRA
ncbi:glycine zipper 2TM domain-containing protein [Noviherbaspirillum sp.]|uniref:glycine zipper 2TM domain-containing protein n=1 Tax=Noviherbaspirillum sp. TaxID=1926288 RepID=UPI002B46D910|nr:glycine zipper 2TM domain-containing protein [Noviherbaspirillum sp.]HJV81782.1 glycine zipper 2TM domain-containing protein [Noviherbaspirillum sp.]